MSALIILSVIHVLKVDNLSVMHVLRGDNFTHNYQLSLLNVWNKRLRINIIMSVTHIVFSPKYIYVYFYSFDFFK
jgi:hypothetical protein